MQHNRTLRVITAFLLLTAGIILFLILNVCIGTVSIPLKDIFSSIRGQEVLNVRILWDIRMPRTLAALILGGALALAGYLLQTFFHNPIAGPFVLGISSGAKMMVALFMVFFMGRSIRVTSFTMILAAFLGAMICMGFVLLMARRVNQMSMLVVSGVMIFFITSNGLVQIRRSSDYIPKMIELAGGRYIFEDMGKEGGRSTMNIQIEEFYEGAKDADFLIYNSTIDGGVDSIAQLLEKCPVLEDFKAVQEGNVFCTTNDYYQQSMSVGDLMKDFHIMLLRGDDTQMKYLFRLK
jgi:hypothetical protein